LNGQFEIHTNIGLIVGEKTGPVTGLPPPVSDETKAALADATNASPTRSHVPGQDAGSKAGTPQAAEGEKKVKSEKECMRNPYSYASGLAIITAY
jgi:hypothetical protein